MIMNDEQLEVVKQLLGQSRDFLTRIRKDIQPKNPALYEMMSVQCKSTICELDSYINEYEFRKNLQEIINKNK